MNKQSLPCSSVYEQTTNPYYIVTPDYTHKSSGVRLLHEMCSILNQNGYESYVVTGKTEGKLWTPRLTEETKAEHYLAKKIPIVVYPEVIKGAPLNIGVPVRYVLNYPGLIGGDKEYGKNEIIFSFLDEYYPSGIPLNLPVTNIKLIDSIGGKKERSKGSSAFYYNRNQPTDSEIESFGPDCIEISPKKSACFNEMISILKSVEVLYCFENSNIIVEAILSGCAVVFIQSQKFNQTPRSLEKLGFFGYTWSRDEEDIKQAILTVGKMRDALIKSFMGWEDRLNRFITITQSESKKMSYEIAWPQEVIDGLPISGLSSKEKAARLDANKYTKVNKQYKEWQSKSTIREINADIYAEYIANGDLPSISVVIHHANETSLGLIADTIESIEANFLKANYILIVSDNDPPDGYESSTVLSWTDKNSITNNFAPLDTSSWVLTIEAGVRIAPNALVEFAISAREHPEAVLFYADEDIFSEDGIHKFPNFKPAFNIELIRCCNYVGGTVLFNQSSWLKSGMPAATNEVYQYLLSCSISQDSKHVHHVDGMLIHGTGKIHPTVENLEYIAAKTKLLNIGIAKSVMPMDRLGSWLVEYSHVTGKNTTLVIPTGVQPGYLRQFLESINKYPCSNLDKIILVCNEIDFEEVDYALQGLECSVPMEVIRYDANQYNHAEALNLAIVNIKTEYVWVCDDDVELIHDDTLGILLSIANQTEVGCVEPRLMSTHEANARLVSGPMVLGMQGTCASYSGVMQLPEEYGYFSKLQLTQDVSAVSGHCFVFRTSHWHKVGGFDQDQFGLKFTVLDFALKLNRIGCRHVWAPLANAMHHGGRSIQKRLSDFQFKVSYAQDEVKEKNKLLELWGEDLANDRFYNRHLSLVTPYDVESSIVIDWNPKRNDRPKVLACPLISGAGQYRVIEPLEMLQDKGLVESVVIMPKTHRQSRILQPIELIRARPDTLLLQHSVDDTQLSLIEQYKKALRSVHIIQTVDDLMGFVPEKHPSRSFQRREGHSRMIEAIKKSDSMIVTTEPLKNHYNKYIENVKIIPNCLAKHWFTLTPSKTKRDRLRVGWIGAGQHQGDLEIINEAVKILSLKVDWIFMGMHTAQVKPYIKEFHQFVSIKDYPEKMASLDLDIAVAPLEDNFFNQCKSNLRLLEYGAMSWPVVCSDVYPYQNNTPPVFRCGPDVKEWVTALEALINDEKLRVEMGGKLREWVVENYSLEDWKEDWSEALFDKTSD